MHNSVEWFPESLAGLFPARYVMFHHSILFALNPSESQTAEEIQKLASESLEILQHALFARRVWARHRGCIPSKLFEIVPIHFIILVQNVVQECDM